MNLRKNITVLLAVIIATFAIGCGSSNSSNSKEAKADSLPGTWYAIEKDKNSDIVSGITILQINNSETAHLTSWNLKGNTFSGPNGKSTKILWQSTEFDLALSKSGNTLTFTVPNAKEMGTVLECKFDESKEQLRPKDGENFFTKKEISVQDIKEENIKAYQEFAAKQGIHVDIEKDMTNSEYMEFVKVNTFGN